MEKRQSVRELDTILNGLLGLLDKTATLAREVADPDSRATVNEVAIHLSDTHIKITKEINRLESMIPAGGKTNGITNQRGVISPSRIRHVLTGSTRCAKFNQASNPQSYSNYRGGSR